MVKNYYLLTKPGIIYGNAITTVAGFFLASKGQINFWLFLTTMVGISLVVGSGCVLNNYLDRNIDKKMARTKKRALVTGVISNRNAIIYGAILGLIGMGILFLYTNLLTVFIGLVGYFFYVVVYSIWVKPHSVYGTELGSISGAVPPVVGYVAVTNHLDLGALLLFLILVFWQMPHFFAIAIRRRDDYAAASIPVLPVKNGIKTTKVHMLLYCVGFVIAVSLLTVFGYTGYIYLVVASLLSLGWLGYCITGFQTKDDTKWAKKMFLFSLVIILVLSLNISVDAFLPI